jgi:hypothetical protein
MLRWALCVLWYCWACPCFPPSSPHKAWYSDKGNDQIFASPVIVRDDKTHERSYSDKQFMTFHIYGTQQQQGPQHDAGYDAFVKLYRDNSDIKSEYSVCLPDLKQK